METKEIIEMLEQLEKETWENLKRARLISDYGQSAYERAASRWATVDSILRDVKYIQQKHSK